MLKYSLRGLEVTSVHIDNQFNNDEFEQGIKPATIVPYAADEHVLVPFTCYQNLGRKRINFGLGQYVEIHDGTDNTISERSKGAIAMYATNDRGGYAFCRSNRIRQRTLGSKLGFLCDVWMKSWYRS